MSCPPSLSSILSDHQTQTTSSLLYSARAFVHGLTTSDALLAPGTKLSHAERTRLVYSFVCSAQRDGGLGVTAGAVGWTRVKSVMVLHDQKWNDRWIVQWATSLDVDASLDALRAQVGFHLEPVPEFFS